MESLSSPGAVPAPAGGEIKRKRTAFDKKEKEIFCTILKNSDGGRIWRIINEGTTTNQTLGQELPSFSMNQLGRK